MSVIGLAIRKIKNYYSPVLSELRKIAGYPRYTKGRSSLEGGIEFSDSASFVTGYDEIFIRENYLFKTDKNDPLIIDCGSNIGLSVIYFKKIYPSARIIAFEPDPDIFLLLKKNSEYRNLDHVVLYNKAITASGKPMYFVQDGGFSGHIADSEVPGSIKVDTCTLSSLITEPVELLKIDIEGAETEVIMEAKDSLTLVKRIFIEYHSITGNEQQLDNLLAALKEKKFRVHIKEAVAAPHPFVEVPSPYGMDNQIEIYAWQ